MDNQDATRAAQEKEDLWKFLLETEDPDSARQKLFDDLSSQAGYDKLDVTSSRDVVDKFQVPTCSISSTEEERDKVKDRTTKNTEEMVVLMDCMEKISILTKEDLKQARDDDPGLEDVEMKGTDREIEELGQNVATSSGYSGPENVASTSQGTPFENRTFFESAQFDLEMLDELATEREQWLSRNNQLKKKFPLVGRNEPHPQTATPDSVPDCCLEQQNAGAAASSSAHYQDNQLMTDGLGIHQDIETEASGTQDLPRRQNLMASMGLSILDALHAERSENINETHSSGKVAVRCDIPEFMSKLKQKEKPPVNRDIEVFEYREEDEKLVSDSVKWDPTNVSDSSTDSESMFTTKGLLPAFLDACDRMKWEKARATRRLMGLSPSQEKYQPDAISDPEDFGEYWHVDDIFNSDELFPSE